MLVFQQLVILLDLIKVFLLGKGAARISNISNISNVSAKKHIALCEVGRGISKQSDNPNQYCQFTSKFIPNVV